MTDLDLAVSGLDQYATHQSPDPAKIDLELTHDPCGTAVCDIQATDNLESHVRAALRHECAAP